MILEAFGSHIFDRFCVKFEAFGDPFWVILELLEAIFAPLGPPAADLLAAILLCCQSALCIAILSVALKQQVRSSIYIYIYMCVCVCVCDG